MYFRASPTCSFFNYLLASLSLLHKQTLPLVFSYNTPKNYWLDFTNPSFWTIPKIILQQPSFLCTDTALATSAVTLNMVTSKTYNTASTLFPHV